MNPDFKAAESQQSAGAPASELDAIKEELASLRSVLQYQVADLMDAKKQRQRPVHSYLTQCLTGMGLSASLAEQLVHYTPSQYTEREAWIYLLNLLAMINLPIIGALPSPLNRNQFHLLCLLAMNQV